MHNLSEFIEYQGNEHRILNGEHFVLAWSEKTGYYFCQYGFCVDIKIIAIEDKQ